MMYWYLRENPSAKPAVDAVEASSCILCEVRRFDTAKEKTDSATGSRALIGGMQIKNLKSALIAAMSAQQTDSTYCNYKRLLLEKR